MIASLISDRTHRSAIISKLAALPVAIVIGFTTSAADAQQSFKTPEQAAEALVNTARTSDFKGMLRVLGRNGADIASSGDRVADAAARKMFIDAYDAKHQISVEDNRKATLVVGQDDFPFPIPLVRHRGRWLFDTVAGRAEILYRRIGRNELDTIQTCLAYVDAQNEYAEKNPSGAGVGVYAQRVVSTPGRKDGLYWPASTADGQSPLGEFAAQATAQGYRVGGARAPYHGYYYRILTHQGPNAAGGALNYVVGGKMIGGFALVAWPADYGNSGVMTFLVSHQGSVVEKDLGPRTSGLVRKVNAFNPDKTWKKTDATAAAR